MISQLIFPMRLLPLLFLLILPFMGWTQKRPVSIDTIGNKVRFLVVADTNRATKEGVYMNGFVVNLSYSKLREWQGKTLLVEGRVSVIKGINNQEGDLIRQGREHDMKYIAKPRITVLSK